MPDFSLSQGGWGVGESSTNLTFYLVVLEEWADGTVSRVFGRLRIYRSYSVSSQV
jgi:hypothetical protein